MAIPVFKWRTLFAGVKWGVLATAITSIVFPILYVVSELLRYALSEARIWSLAHVSVAVICAVGVLEAFYFTIPNVLGGCLLSLGQTYILPQRFQLRQSGMWMGVVVGGVSAWAGFSVFSIHYGRVNTELLNSVFIVVVSLWKMMLWGWIGHHTTKAP
jgi:hypothetical protein